MSVIETILDKYGNPHRILFDNDEVSEQIKQEVHDIILEAEAPYEALILKYGKDKIYYNPKINTYFLSL